MPRNPEPEPVTASLPLSPLRLTLIVGATLAVVLFVFAPRLWVFREVAPGSYQWARATTYLQQCEDPFRTDIEPAMVWRLLPPLVCHAAGLRGQRALVLPWIGLLAAVTCAATLAARRHADWKFSAGCALLFASSSAILVPLHWLGINDGWVWAGLLLVAFSRSRLLRILALLLAPWVDERFLIALPLALLVRAAEGGHQPDWRTFRDAGWTIPYVALRLLVPREIDGLSATNLHWTTVLTGFWHWLPFAPLGWWMAWRAGVLPVAYALRRQPAWLGSATVLTLVLGTILAADLSRTAAMLAPLALAGCFFYAQDEPAKAPRRLLALALINLLIPAAHVVYRTIDLINPLPIELWRLWRNVS